MSNPKCPDCGKRTERKVTLATNAKNPNREYFVCPRCPDNKGKPGKFIRFGSRVETEEPPSKKRRRNYESDSDSEEEKKTPTPAPVLSIEKDLKKHLKPLLDKMDEILQLLETPRKEKKEKDEEELEN